MLSPRLRSGQAVEGCSTCSNCRSGCLRCDFEDRLLVGLSAVRCLFVLCGIDVGGMKLSGGQIQRVATAWQRVFGLHVTCLVMSYRPAVLTRADQVLVLAHGQIV